MAKFTKSFMSTNKAGYGIGHLLLRFCFPHSKIGG